MATKTTNKPVEVLRDGFLKATIWQNEGEKGVYFTASLAKTYEKDGSLHDSQSFSSTDLLPVAELARQAYKEIRRLRLELSND